MYVETKQSYLLFALVTIGFCVVCSAFAIGITTGSVLGFGILLLLGSILGYRGYVLYGRTLIFDETGCTVCFRKDRVHCSWDQLVVKRVEPPHTFNVSGYWNGGMFFSLRPCKKAASVDPQIYVSFHIYTSFWVYFKPSNPVEAKNSLGIYEVDKQEFLSQLDAWGVAFENIRY